MVVPSAIVDRGWITVAEDFLFTSDWFEGAYLLKADNPHFSGVEPNVKQNVKGKIEKATIQSEITQTNALLPSLHQLVDFVDGLVLSFKPFLE